GDDAAALILGRETFLKARELVEAWDDSRDWIDLKTEQKVDLNAYAAQKIAGTPKEAAAILRRYAADAKAKAPQSFGLAVGGSRKDKKSFLARWLPATDKSNVNNDSDLPEYNPKEWQEEERYLAKTKTEIAAFRKTSAAQDFKGVADFLRKKYNIDVSRLDKAPEIATIYTDGILDVMERFGNVGTLHRVVAVDSLPNGRVAQFTSETKILEVLRLTREQFTASVKKEFETGNWASGDLRGVARHEMGHVVSTYLQDDAFADSVRARFLRVLDRLFSEAAQLPPERWKSDYSFHDEEEFFAEIVAAYLDDSLPQGRKEQARSFVEELLSQTPLRN
ncbi:MAG: hypothetical protein IJZ10_06730, partial [Thermoguttaceae bacterium]|nr:hypothetical protein [Thermoguttaceae bacterium]